MTVSIVDIATVEFAEAANVQYSNYCNYNSGSCRYLVLRINITLYHTRYTARERDGNVDGDIVKS